MLYFQSLEEVYSALKRRMGLIVLLSVIGIVAAVVFALTRVPTYNAIAVVQIEDAQVAGTNTSAGSVVDTRAGLDAQRTVSLIEQRIMSRGTLEEIMAEFDLFSDNPSMTATERLLAMRKAVTIEAILTGQAWQPAQAVSGMVIDVKLSDPQKAADVANNLLDRVLAEARARSIDRAQVELQFFNAEEARIREEIIAAEAVVAEYKSANAEALPTNITVLQGELTTLNASMLTLRQQILSLEANSSRTRPEALERQVSLLEDQIRLIEQRIATINSLLARAPAVERELVALERELAQLNEQFIVISRRKADAEMSQTLEQQRQLARFEVLERALVPVYPVSRSKRLIAVAGSLASVMMAVGVALGLEMLNPPIRTAAQMERALGIRPVISVPVIESKVPTARKTGGNGSRFGLGVLVALLLGGIALIAKPLAEMAGFNLSPRNAQ